MSGYYEKKLGAERLMRCYEIASPRVKQYLEAELVHVSGKLKKDDAILELGCGYGRATMRLAQSVRRAVGIDVVPESLALAYRLDKEKKCEFIHMDATDLHFRPDTFDAVVCIQNGICAFNVDKELLLRQALRVTRPGGTVLLSSYSDNFWPDRLSWFEAQSAEGLVGPLDRDRCRDGFIVCTDGFSSGRMTGDDFKDLCARLGVECEITEVDNSSLFCEIRKKA